MFLKPKKLQIHRSTVEKNSRTIITNKLKSKLLSEHHFGEKKLQQPHKVTAIKNDCGKNKTRNKTKLGDKKQG